MSGAVPAEAGWILGVDSGGSGLRVALARSTAPSGGEVAAVTPSADGTGSLARADTAIRTPVRTGPRGIDPDHLLELLLPAVTRLRAQLGGLPASTPVQAVCVGAAGMATLGEALHEELPGALAGHFATRRLALAADGVTGYAGALGQRPGVVVAAGTGMIALGTDLHSWHRVDGWGHLLGDSGSGAWIGRAGLAAAMRAHDGRPGGSPALLARAEQLFGPAGRLPARIYPRTDRPAVLASFAPEVADAATTGGDPVAREILRQAGREIAETAAAACPDPETGSIALTGGLLRIGEPLLGPLRARLDELLPQARLVPAAGDPLDGAVLVAGQLAAGTLSLPPDASLLRLN